MSYLSLGCLLFSPPSLEQPRVVPGSPLGQAEHRISLTNLLNSYYMPAPVLSLRPSLTIAKDKRNTK